MTDIAFHHRLTGWRIAGWSAAAALLALPAIAMQFTDEVDWTAFDFVVAGALLALTGLAAEGGLRLARNWPHLIGFALTTFAAFFTVWSNLAVGIIGDEGAPVNRGFFVVLALGLIAAAFSKFQPRALAVITGAVAVSQIALGLVAEAAMPGHAVEWPFLAGFALVWLAASLAFHRASRAEPAA